MSKLNSYWMDSLRSIITSPLVFAEILCLLINPNSFCSLAQGRETKSMLNNNGPRYKRSKLERKLNTDVIFCIILLFAMCLVGALGQ